MRPRIDGVRQSVAYSISKNAPAHKYEEGVFVASYAWSKRTSTIIIGSCSYCARIKYSVRGGVEKLNTARGVAECCIELRDPNPSAVYNITRTVRNNHVITTLLYFGWENLLYSSPRVPRVAGFCINNARAFSNRFQVDFATREKASWT